MESATKLVGEYASNACYADVEKPELNRIIDKIDHSNSRLDAAVNRIEMLEVRLMARPSAIQENSECPTPSGIVHSLGDSTDQTNSLISRLEDVASSLENIA